MTRAPCRAGDTKRVMQLLAGDGGAQLNEKDKNGDITKMWVGRQGAQVENGWTALLWWASLKQGPHGGGEAAARALRHSDRPWWALFCYL